jgi:SAM-dependent methyltransferase
LKRKWVFDEEQYRTLNPAREAVVRNLIPEFKKHLGKSSPKVIDVGCGIGHYSNVLHDLGCDVIGVDAREENVLEARRRFPHLAFKVADAEDPNLCESGMFDIVFCFGLLYHLENPFRTIRTLAAMASDILLVETMVYPSPEPILVLMDEIEANDQAMKTVAYYPSELGVIKMMLQAGFVETYIPLELPAHPEFEENEVGFRRRTVVIGAKSGLDLSSLRACSQPPKIHPWDPMVPLWPIRGKSGRIYTLLEERLHGLMRPSQNVRRGRT